ncbi:MAG: GNAT family N-acetyltransferase, partial [Candidatus Sericytochromatia bacterium]
EREYVSGVNRFDGPSEVLFVVTDGETPVAVCGLNRDPYLDDPGVGRVRHLYVLKAYRHLGLGRSLVVAVMDAARGPFHMLTLRTENPVAARLYASLGFVAEPAVAHATHWCRLSDGAPTDPAR